MGRNVKVNVEYLTRVEGHGNIVVNVKDGKLEEYRLSAKDELFRVEAKIRRKELWGIEPQE